MKKNHTMRAASLLLVLTLITSCFVGGTFAKYTTEIAGSDTARVAKFGVTLDADANLFDKQYAGNDTISVLASNTDDVIAPGTAGNAVFFSINGAPEVDVQVTASLGTHTVTTLPAGTYTDYTHNVLQTDGTYDYTDKFTVPAEGYKPVKWTLVKDGTDVAGCVNVNLNTINDYLVNTLSGKYDVETPEKFNAINGQYALKWVWAIDGNDAADTFMGNVAAGVVPAPTDYIGTESFGFSLRVEQVD